MKIIFKNFPQPKAGPGNIPAVQLQVKFREGLALQNIGQLAQAQAIYHQILKLQPKHFDSLHMLGVLAGRNNHPTEAVEWLGKAIEVNANSASAYSNLGNALSGMRHFQAAIASYDKAIAINPSHVKAHANRGKALYALKEYRAAVESFEKAIAIKPNYADVYCDCGMALSELKQYQAAVASYDKAIAIKSDYAFVHRKRGSALISLRQYQAAIDSFDKAIAVKPGDVEACTNRGRALHGLKMYQAAINSYEKAIALEPNNAAAYYNRGIALNDLKRHRAAIESYDHAVAIKPDFADAYLNCGVALYFLEQHQAAIESFDKAIAIKQDNADAYANRGHALSDLKQYDAALESYDKAISLHPNHEFLFGARLNTKTQICDWRDAEQQIAELIQKIKLNDKVSPTLPVLALSASPSMQRKAAEIWMNAMYPANFELGGIPKRTKGEKIRIGYFSMDFNNHPVSYLTAGLIESHDRDKFEVYAFSFGPDTKDEMRIRLEAAFDKFIDVQSRSDKEIAELARQMQVDIAIDLGGFTKNSRTGIFALRAAPLQVNYLGYPGTMGADYMDYLIADRQLIPEEAKVHYAEKIVYLPSFQANDDQRKISDRVFSREELGLPQTGFVFCCFNNSYKITPSTFDGWMRILKQVDGSVLWLSEANPTAAENLRKEAKVRGVDTQRLVFARKIPLLAEHMARHRAADLFIDTLPYNAHTTASDALWAGLPVLTCAGEALASRVAASLLSAIDLPELITTTQEEYEARAVELATMPERLKVIKEKLERNRLTTPLFDTKVFTKHIEDAYTQMYERYQAGLVPEHIYVGTMGKVSLVDA